MSLNDIINNYQGDIKQLTQLAIKSDNLFLLEVIEKNNKNIFKQSDILSDENNIFNICKYSSSPIYEYMIQKGAKFNIIDKQGNTCLHYAAKYGNLDLIKHIAQKKDKSTNFNAQNQLQETPLHVALKNGLHKYQQVVILLSRLTDLTIKDNENKEPHRIKIKNLKQNVRLSEYLDERYKVQCANINNNKNKKNH